MVTVDDLLQKALSIDLNYLIPLSLIDSSEEFVRLQREQLSKGQRADGRPIFNIKTGSASYSPSYAKKKGKSSPIDLHDTGAFYGATFLHVDDDKSYVIDSADSKSGKLQENYGEAIFDLNDESRVSLIPIAQANLFNEVEKALL